MEYLLQLSVWDSDARSFDPHRMYGSRALDREGQTGRMLMDLVLCQGCPCPPSASRLDIHQDRA